MKLYLPPRRICGTYSSKQTIWMTCYQRFYLPRTMIVYVFDNKVSNSTLYVEERIGASGSFILIAIISFSIQEDQLLIVLSMKEYRNLPDIHRWLISSLRNKSHPSHKIVLWIDHFAEINFLFLISLTLQLYKYMDVQYQIKQIFAVFDH